MENNGFLFTKKNYQFMIIGIAFIVTGFILMWGGGAADDTSFNPEIFSFTRITLAPIFILIGFVIEIFAIMHKPKN
jgi:fumarate reductase subunit D